MRYIFWVVTLILIFCFIQDTQARPNDWKEIAKEKAQVVIDACWAISEEDRNGSNASIRQGHLKTALCMEEHIVNISQQYLFKDDPEQVKRVKDDLERFRSGYGHFYWMLYNEVDPCFNNKQSDCGTVFHSFHNYYYAESLERVVINVYEQLIFYGILED